MSDAIVEFEIKAFATSELLSAVAEIASFQGENDVVDDYLDTVDAALFRKGAFLRIRDGRRVDVKFNPDVNDDSHLRCLERAYALPLSVVDRRSMRELLMSLIPRHAASWCAEEHEQLAEFRLVNLATIEKKRATYLMPGLQISVDVVSGLGSFIEIEALTEESVSAAVKLAERFGLANLSVGYVELALRKSSFELYKQGRYLLEEDL